MSIELPEAKILANQMNKALCGKRIKSYDLQNYARLQKIGMMDKDLTTFKRILDQHVLTIMSRGNVIRLKLSNQMNILLAPEYGGKIFYHSTKNSASSKYHLKIDFDDDTVLTVRLTSMGLIHAATDSELENLYVYQRDFNEDIASPLDPEFTFKQFAQLLSEKNKMLKLVLVGKDAIVVGLSNSAFQDILYRAQLHPKRKAAELTKEQKQALYDAMRFVLHERVKMNGKNLFFDLYGNQGGYTPAMGPHMKQETCRICGTQIEKLSVGGGSVYLCPQCQVAS
jgi:formamidopyrimidine-DNA glycosylase